MERVDKVTLTTILEGVDYPPVPGLKYEVAPGKCVTLKVPTRRVGEEYEALVQSLRDAYNSEDKEDHPEWPDLQLAKAATDGEWPDEPDLIPPVVTRISLDCPSAAQGMRLVPSMSSAALRQQAQEPQG